MEAFIEFDASPSIGGSIEFLLIIQHLVLPVGELLTLGNTLVEDVSL